MALNNEGEKNIYKINNLKSKPLEENENKNPNNLPYIP